MAHCKKYVVVDTVSKLKNLAQKMWQVEEFAFDTETNTLRVYGDNKDFRIVDISISWGEYNNYMIPMGHVFDDNNLSPKIVRKYLGDIFAREDITLIGHNIKFDLHVLARIGIYVKTPKLFDTMIASWLCDENSPNGLKQNTETILGIDQTHIGDVFNTVSKEEKKAMGLKASNKATFDLVRIENAELYVVDDSYFTFQLYLYFLDKLKTEGMEKIYYNTYPPFIIVLFRMEERGVTLDLPKLKQMGVDMQEDMDNLLFDIYELAGVKFNPGSSQQLAELLFGYDQSKNVNQEILAMTFDFPVISTTPKGVPQSSTGVLERIVKKEYKSKRKQEGVQLVEKLLEYKKLAKLKTAFVDGLLEQCYDDGKVHPSFNPIGTDSGRISCSSPNLMQMPNAKDDDKYQIRDCFIGDIDNKTGKRKHIISVDFSNLEVRVMAHFSQDEALIKAFLEGKDLHGNTAKMMFRLDCDANDVKKKYPELRQQGKVIAFLLQYGGSAYTLCDDLNKDGDLDRIAKEQKDNKESDFFGCKTAKDVAQRLMDLYFNGFPGIAKFMKHQKKFAHRHEYVLTLVGRKRRLPDINGDDYKTVSYLERLSINACIQGSGADIMINAQNKIEGTRPVEVSNKYLEEQGLDTKFIASDRLKELDCEMLVQIHDELLFQCPEENCEEAMQIIRDCMINPFGENVKLNVPLEVGMGHSKSYQGGH